MAHVLENGKRYKVDRDCSISECMLMRYNFRPQGLNTYRNGKASIDSNNLSTVTFDLEKSNEHLRFNGHCDENIKNEIVIIFKDGKCYMKNVVGAFQLRHSLETETFAGSRADVDSTIVTTKMLADFKKKANQSKKRKEANTSNACDSNTVA